MRWAKSRDGQAHLEVPSLVQAATLLQGHAGVSIEEVPIVTLTPLKARPRAWGRHGEAGAGEVARAGAELIVTVGWAGESWTRRRNTFIATQTMTRTPWAIPGNALGHG